MQANCQLYHIRFNTRPGSNSLFIYKQGFPDEPDIALEIENHFVKIDERSLSESNELPYIRDDCAFL